MSDENENHEAEDTDRRLPRSLPELREIVRSELSKLLGNNVTSDGLHGRPTALLPDDVIWNVHLFERLGAAYEAVRALKPHYGRHPGFRLSPRKFS